MNLGLFFACVYLKEIENYFMFLGVCDWYTLLKTPDNMVTIPSTILWGNIVLCDRASCEWVPFPCIIKPWSFCESRTQNKPFSSSPPVQHQDSWAPGWLLPSLLAWKVPGPRHCHRTGKPNSTQSTVYKIKQRQVLSGELGQEMLLNSETRDLPMDKNVSTVICCLQGLSDLDSLYDFWV